MGAIGGAPSRKEGCAMERKGPSKPLRGLIKEASSRVEE